MKLFYNGLDVTPEKFGKIVIYGNGKILYKIDSDCFEIRAIDKKSKEMKLTDSFYSHNGITEITKLYLNKELKKANKENLDRKDNYYISWSPDYCTWEKRKAVYIHVSEIGVTDLGDILAMETKDEKNYLHTVKLSFNCKIEHRIKNIEKIYLKDGECWSIPEGGKWSSCYGSLEAPCYEVFDENDYIFTKKENPGKGVLKKWFSFEEVEKPVIIACERYYTKRIESAERTKRRELAEILNKAKLSYTFSHYDIERLEQYVDIIAK